MSQATEAARHGTFDSAASSSSPGWKTAVNWSAAILIALVFLVAGIWKASDPSAAAVRLAQAKVPAQLSVATALLLGIAETFAGVLLIVPRFRRWGALLGSLLLLAFMAYIGYFYSDLRGAECSCFPWVKRAVGPGFFVGDALMLGVAILAGVGAKHSSGLKPAALVLAAVSVFAVVSYGVAETRHTGTRAPASIAAQDGSRIQLTDGNVLIYFFDPACMHCVEVGRRLSGLQLSGVPVVGVPVATPQFGNAFLQKTGLTAKISTDLTLLRKTFPFEAAPAIVALRDGRAVAQISQFDENEPAATLREIGFLK